MTNSNSSKKVGRPTGSDGDAVRQNLLDAARQLFARREFKAVSVKQIAQLADVNGAMVHYYFGDKKGLYMAMVEQLLTPMFAKLEQLEAQEQHSLEDFILLYTTLLADNPWWPNFVIREVLFGDEQFRDSMIKKLGQRLAPKLLSLFQHEIAEGRFREDLKPEYAFLSLMGMMVFPFLSKPISEKTLDIEISPETAKQLAEHTQKLFLAGVSRT